MWTPHALAPGPLQNVAVLLGLNLAFFCFIHCAEVTMPPLSLLDLLPFAFQSCLSEAFWIGMSDLF